MEISIKKAALHNLGCKVNAYETEAMQQLLEENGYEIVPFSQKADVYVINTCAVTGMAEHKSRQMLHRAKKKNPQSIVVAVGCYVQTAAEKLKADLAIDILIGNDKKHELVPQLRQFEAKRLGDDEAKKKQNTILNIMEEKEFADLKVSKTSERTRAFLKVQDGCSQFCSYCIIPYARGRSRSRNINVVYDEAVKLAATGYQEIVLTGIHLSSYGIDQKEDLLSLICRVHEIEGIKRIRLGSLEPQIVTEEFVKELAQQNKVCPHFHLSLQSGCDETLTRMNRNYTVKIYQEGCERLRKYFNHPAITTDVIVGFPGETDAEFNITRNFLKKIGFFEVHIFKYSRREGTRADKMAGQLPEQEKQARSSLLFHDTEKMSQEFLEWYQDKELEVLFEERINVDGKEMFWGHTKEYIKIAAAAKADLTNQIILTKAGKCWRDHILHGVIGTNNNINFAKMLKSQK